MALFGCASDEQFFDELYEEISQRDYDLHYCETHDAYYCPEAQYCNPAKNYFPAMNQCKAYRRYINAQKCK